MKVLYVCFIDFENINSGSAVRPYSIYNSFINRGYEVLLINGDAKNRRAKFDNYKNQGKITNIDYCYIELPTYPIHPTDYVMFLYFRKMNMKIGMFYRDIYYKFPEYFKYKGLKKHELIIRFKLDLAVYKFVTRYLFTPSDEMGKLFKFKNKAALPPAGNILNIREKLINYTVIYVGGISKNYGTENLLKALKIVNESYRKINLIIVCRDYNNEYFDKYKNEEWLEIIHASGEKLEKLYNRSDIAIIPNEVNEYHNFAFSIKLFEYLSFGMPVIATDCFEMSVFIKNNNVGIITNDNPKDIAQSIIYLYKNPEMINQFVSNSLSTIKNGNTWDHRIDKIEEYLLRDRTI